jgi:serine/threonine protein kinase/tetratricopeptide (TPR) repeat protein
MAGDNRDPTDTVTDARERTAASAQLPQEPTRDVMIGDRFVISRLAGKGGMGSVYLATDRTNGAPVAVKVIHGRDDNARFSQEAHVLAELQHPAVVRYLAHGELADGQRFLAMEWLDGEDLARRLDRGPLAVVDAVVLARRAAAGLAIAHQRGIVHRDIKPSNLFLVDGDPAQLKLLDFGVARLARTRHVLTATGTVIGSLGYMAPEQAIGARDVDVRADVFALGCVLFECLSGQRAFSGEHVAAILAKVLREEAPRVSSLRPEVPLAVDDLVARMLAKDRDARPRDANAVVAEIDSLPRSSMSSTEGPARLTTSEQRLVSVILAELESDPAEFERISRQFGAELVRLADGTLLLTLVTLRDSATDHAARMASLALALRGTEPTSRIALATGRADISGRQPVGPALDSAATLLACAAEYVRIDDVTSSLLDSRFEQHDGMLLARREVDAARRLLGKTTPCVGRDKELVMLDATLAECLTEQVSRAMLVTAGPGIGKSRLRLEFLERARATGVAIWSARADPVSAGSSHGLVRQLVRVGASLREGEAASAQLARLAGHLAQLFHGDALTRTCEYLGELIGISTATPATRSDPALIGEWMRRSFESWVAAECARRPLLIVLEDLHWGDASSVEYLSGVLRTFAERPLLVLAFARPEVHDLFPRLWSDNDVQEIRLAGLTRRAADRLVHAVLGDDRDADEVARIVDRAGGNAYYLEELIRHAHEGGSDLPATILAMTEARLDRLEPEARRILRAASVFGEVFWGGGVTALVGDAQAIDAAAWLRTLVDRELLSIHGGDKFPGETEYAFRHGLLRDASYAMLTDADRSTAHRLAAGWLERAGEKDALVLANHFERGGETTRAMPWLVRAVNAAYDGHQYEAALALADRGIALGISGATLGTLRRVQASSASAIGRFPLMRDCARGAMALLPRGKALWIRATGGCVFAELNLGNTAVAVALIEDMIGAATDPELDTTSGFGLCIAIYGGHWIARGDLLRAGLERIEALYAAYAGPIDPMFEAWRVVARIMAAWSGVRLLGDEVQRAAEAIERFDKTGDVHGIGYLQYALAMTYGEVGDIQHAARFDAMRRAGQRAGYWYYTDGADFSCGRAWGFAGCFDEMSRRVASISDHAFRPLARGLLAWSDLARGDLDAAESGAHEALAGAWCAFYAGIPTAVLAEVALASGDAKASLRWADDGLARLRAMDSINEVSWLRLTRARALQALGEHERARTEILEARTRVLRIADAHDDPAMRASYLTTIVPSARTLALAQASADVNLK